MKKIKLILCFALIAIWGTLFSQTLIVTDDPTYTTGNASSVLDVKSSAKGFLAPRMLQTERSTILSPAEGLLVYQTDETKGFYYYNGVIWILIASGTISNYLPLAGGTLTGELDASGGFKLGSTGTVLQKILKTSVTITDNTAIEPGVSLTLTIDITGATLNSTVIVNPSTALSNGLGIAYSYVSAVNTVIMNIICTNGTLILGTQTFDITIIQ